MNIFVTDTSPRKSAQALDDLRLNKMILESAQLLCSTLRLFGVRDDRLYSITHTNHPCRIWTGQTLGNFNWLLDHAYEMVEEKMVRYTQAFPHKCYGVLKVCEGYSSEIRSGRRTPFANCTPYKQPPITPAYRQTMRDKWAADLYPTWTRRGPPAWR